MEEKKFNGKRITKSQRKAFQSEKNGKCFLGKEKKKLQKDFSSSIS